MKLGPFLMSLGIMATRAVVKVNVDKNAGNDVC